MPKKLLRGVFVGSTATLAAAAMLVSAGSGAAHAAIVGTCGSNNLPAPPTSVNLGATESNSQVTVFAEKKGVTLGAPLQADITNTTVGTFPATYANNQALPNPASAQVPAGTVVDSYYIHSEPVGATAQHYSATIRFDQPVLGVMLQWDDNIDNPGTPTFGPFDINTSDPILGAPGVNYNTPAHNARGLEMPNVTKVDQVTWVDADTISVNLLTQSERDDIRVVTAATPAGSTKTQGYRFVATDGGIFTFGNQGFLGSMGGSHLNKPIVGGTNTCDAGGYWMVASDGGIFTFGDAHFYGSMGNKPLNKPIVTMAGTPDSKGYWEFATDGGVFTFGDAHFWGSTGNIVLNKPVVSAASTPTGLGYWMAASDGGIFSFGDAHFWGSTGAIHLNKPIVGMAATPDGQGYYLVATDGGIFTFGDAKFHGSTGAMVLNKPIVGMKLTPDGNGYWLVASDGGVFSFGDATFQGSTGNIVLNQPIVGVL